MTLGYIKDFLSLKKKSLKFVWKVKKWEEMGLAIVHWKKILKRFQKDSKNVLYKICLRIRSLPFFQNEKNDRKNW